MARIVLDSPIQVTYWELVGLELRKNAAIAPATNAKVVFVMENDAGESWREAVVGTEADGILSSINTADFSGANPTMYERALQWLVDNGRVAGVVQAS